MRKFLLRLILPQEERMAIKTLAEIYHPKVKDAKDETQRKVKSILETLIERFS
jgi:hypothetical protein